MIVEGDMILAIAMTLKHSFGETKVFCRQRIAFYAVSLPAICLAVILFNHSEMTKAQSGLVNNHPAYLSEATELGWSAEYVAEHRQLAHIKPFAAYESGMDL